MEIAGVFFQSLPQHFEKEKSGIKNNIVIIKEDDTRFNILNNFQKGKIDKLFIVITNNCNGEYFEREVRDVSTFQSFGIKYYIITWR